ncbi:uncharacterized protein BDV17DRAFT_270952 [Aspergillus undulatus]|uniref:uncharacterized protein n=1 Tax=Aspergillus undulatus TaxID=1810928 RepID=UPI003CCE4EE6
MRSVAGHYSLSYFKFSRRQPLVDHEAARKAGIAIHGTVGAMERYVSEMNAVTKANYNVRKAAGSNRRRPRTEDVPDWQEANGYRFMAIVRAPVLRLDGLEWGCSLHGLREYR